MAAKAASRRRPAAAAVTMTAVMCNIPVIFNNHGIIGINRDIKRNVETAVAMTCGDIGMTNKSVLQTSV